MTTAFIKFLDELHAEFYVRPIRIQKASCMLTSWAFESRLKQSLMEQIYQVDRVECMISRT